MYDSDYNYSLDEYWQLVDTFLDQKYEYVEGDVRLMTGGSPAHAQIGANIARVLGNALVERECTVYNSDAIVKLSARRYYCPDVSVSCDPADRARTRALEAPVVVIEVISPSTEKIDKTEKLEAYQQHPTIQDILLVDARRRYVEHYYRRYAYTWEVSQYRYEHERIHLASIGARLTLAEIYLKVYLESQESE